MKSFAFHHRVLSVLFAGAAMALSSCGMLQQELEDALASTSQCISSGDVLVSNSGSGAVLIFSSEGTYRGIAIAVNRALETIYGVAWHPTLNKLLVAIDGADRVMAVDPVDCSSTNLITSAGLTGTLRGLAVLGDDIAIVETNNVERFSSVTGTSIATWPKALQTGGSGIAPRASGGFVHCSFTSNVVRNYSDAGVQTHTRASGIAGTAQAADCVELSDGTIAVTWYGTTDTVAIYDSTLATLVASFSNTTVLGNPSGIAELSSGNLIVADRTFHRMVEISVSGGATSYVKEWGSGLLNVPEFIAVVP